MEKEKNKFIFISDGLLSDFNKIYKSFIDNKIWIISLLFVFSLSRDIIWYILFGINILSYASFQDIFNSFFSYVSIVVFTVGLNISTLLFYFKAGKNRHRIWSILELLFDILKRLLLLFLCIYLTLLFKNTLILFVFTMVLIIYIFRYFNGYKKNLLSVILVFLFFISFIQPFIDFSTLRPTNSVVINALINQEKNYDRIKFKYNDNLINTNIVKYYMIGNTTTYYFIYDLEKNETLIIPKDKCENISTQPDNLKLFK
jgi:hypothetical protein